MSNVQKGHMLYSNSNGVEGKAMADAEIIKGSPMRTTSSNGKTSETHKEEHLETHVVCMCSVVPPF